MSLRLTVPDLPLTISLRENVRVPETATPTNLFDFLRKLQENLDDGQVDMDVDLVYTYLSPKGKISPYVTLFSCLRQYSEDNGLTISHPYLAELESYKDIMTVLNRTYWFPRLSHNVRKSLCSKINKALGSKGRRDPALGYVRSKFHSLAMKMKEWCHTVDGIMLSILLSTPGKIRSYKETDRIMAAAMANCINDHDNFLICLKQFRKSVLKALAVNGNFIIPRELSFLKEYYLDLAKYKVDSAYWHYKLAMLTQTRATGLPTGKLKRLSLLKWIKTVTTPCERKWDKAWFQEKLHGIIAKRYPSFDPLGAARISLSTSACLECPVAQGGKAYHARFHLSQADSVVHLVNLETGELTDQVVPKAQIGLWLFHHSLRECINNPLGVNEIKIHQVLEPSKVRTATVSTFAHSGALSPYGHALLKAMSTIPTLKAGIKKSRDGWQVYKEMDYHRNFDSKAKPLALSSDLETATDYMNWHLVSDILEVWNHVMKIPKWYGDLVIRLLTSSRTFVLDNRPFQTLRACMMGDPVTKGVLSSIGLFLVDQIHYIRVKGDDLVGLDHLRAKLEGVLSTIDQLDMKISVLDTFISPDFFKYCEEIVRVPKSVLNTWSYIRNTKCWSRIVYVDYIKLRAILDCKPDINSNEVEAQGKVDLFGRDWSYIGPQGPHNLFSFASFLQDVSLRLHESRHIVYMPSALCGSGKRFPFKIMNCIQFESSRQYSTKWITIISWLNQQRELEPMAKPHGIVRRYERHSKAEPFVLSSDLDILQPYSGSKVVLDSYQKSISSILRKLRDYVATEDEVLGKLLSIEFEKFLLGLAPEPKVQILDIETLQIYLSPVVEPQDLLEIERVWRSEPFLFDNFERTFYHRSAIEELSRSSPLWVPFREPIQGEVLSQPKVEIPPEEEGMRLALWNWFNQPQGTMPPTDLISDDDLIYYQAVGFPQSNVVVVSDDIKLLTRIAKRLREKYFRRKKLYRIPTIRWVVSECSEHQWPLNDAIYLLDLAQIERLLEAAPMLAFGEPGWIAKALSFTEPFNVDCDILDIPELPMLWPEDFLFRG